VDAEAIDFRYAPGWAHRLWLLAAPGSPHKTLVGPWGELRYAPPGRRQYDGDRGWWYQVAWAPQGESGPAPVQRVEDGAALHTAFAGRGDGTQAAVALQLWDSAGHGWDVVRLRGHGAGPSLTVRFNPNLRRLRKVLGPERLQLGSGVLTPLLLWDPALGVPERADPDEDTLRLSWPAWPASGEAWVLLPLGWAEGGWESAPVWPAAPQALWEERVQAARALQARCASPFAAGTEERAFWDAAATGLLQLREQRLRYWYPQPGASHYRGYWVLDGAFIDEALTVAGHAEAARADLELLLAQQTSAGAFLSTVMPFALGHWKETGVGLWALARHLELTADRAWGARVLPAMASAVGWIGHLHAAGAREALRANPAAAAGQAMMSQVMNRTRPKAVKWISSLRFLSPTILILTPPLPPPKSAAPHARCAPPAAHRRQDPDRPSEPAGCRGCVRRRKGHALPPALPPPFPPPPDCEPGRRGRWPPPRR